MLWVLVIIIVIGLCFKFPGFGKFVVTLVGLCIIVGVVIFLYYQIESNLASRRITPDQIEFVGLTLRGREYGTPSDRTIEGRVRNNSPKYTLTRVELKLTMRDVVEGGESEIVGETVETIYAGCPPGQSRHFEDYVHFSGLGKPRGKFAWSYKVVSISGE